MNRRALVFLAPGRVELVDEPLAPPAPGELRARTLASAISSGTELLAYRGQLPPELPVDETLGALRGGTFQYPFRYGYASVGEVTAVGEGVEARWLGRRIFAFVPHASAFTVSAGDAILVPEEVPVEAAASFAAMETAVNLVLDARPMLGEQVLVIGQGIIGLLATALLSRFPLEVLLAVESVPLRAKLSRALGAHAVVAPGAPLPTRDGSDGFDLVLELSGNPAALDAALAAAGTEARVVVGSWYGSKRAAVDLGGAFHRRRLTVTSSQVSRIAPALSARWDRTRRFATTWRALGATKMDAIVTHRFALADAQRAYDLLDRQAESALQVLLLPS